MRVKRIFIVFAIFLTAAGLSACCTGFVMKEFSSPDSMYTIRASGAWREDKESNEPLALKNIQTKQKLSIAPFDKCAVWPYPEKNVSAFEYFCDVTTKYEKKTGMEICGYEAYFVEDVNGYFYCLINAETQYIRIKYKHDGHIDRYRDEFERILNSFEFYEIKYDYSTKDNKFTLTAASVWRRTYNERLHTDAKLELRNYTAAAYLYMIPYEKDGRTPDSFYDFFMQKFGVWYPGHKAGVKQDKQFGEYKGYFIDAVLLFGNQNIQGYLYVAETQDHFLVFVAWSMSGDQYLADFNRIVHSLKVAS